jgi:hypothetical protein
MCFCDPNCRTPFCKSLKCQNELKRLEKAIEEKINEDSYHIFDLEDEVFFKLAIRKTYRNSNFKDLLFIVEQSTTQLIRDLSKIEYPYKMEEGSLIELLDVKNNYFEFEIIESNGTKILTKEMKKSAKVFFKFQPIDQSIKFFIKVPKNVYTSQGFININGLTFPVASKNEREFVCKIGYPFSSPIHPNFIIESDF